MSRKRKRDIRRKLSQFLIILLIASLMFPQFAGAQSFSMDDLTVEEEEQLEIEQEAAVEHGQGDTESQSSARDLLSLTDGLDLAETQDEAEEPLVMDGKIDTRILHTFGESEMVDVIIRLTEQVEMDKLHDNLVGLSSKTDRGETVVNSLQSVADETQAAVMQELNSLEAEGKVSNIQQFWVFNGMAATVSEEALELLAARDDVEKITLDAEIQLPEVQTEESGPRLPEWGLEKVNAPSVWGTYGIEGEGVVVGIMDTGVELEHEALRDNYRGSDDNHEYSWIDTTEHEYATPSDGQGHGTHVAGSAVGGGSGEPIGVAPGAEWIAAKIFNDGGAATTSGIHEAFEWFLAPGGDPAMAPDVVNNSWGNANTYTTEFRDGVNAWIAAGIFPLFAAGNDGPGGQTIGSPASFPESFAVGATDIYDQVAGFSSRGPVSWPDENGEMQTYIKPQVAAPGANIYSAIPGGGYGIKSGTSMATPHVAGAIALILESNPDLTIDEIAALLEDTARTEEHMGELPNNNYGEGIINVYQAVTEAAYAGEVTGQLQDSDGNPINGEISIPEENITVDVANDGAFNFRLREGTHEVEVSSFGYHVVTETITITQGETLEKTWTLEAADRYNITGSVSFENGVPAAYAYVRVEDQPINTVRTNASGEFSISSIPEDDYTLVISGQGIKQVKETVTVDADVTVSITVEAVHIEASEDWATAKNNYQRNPVTEAEVDGEQLAENWTYDTPGRNLFSSPVIADGTVVFTTDNGYVVALDQYTGEELWTLGTGSTNRSTPTVVDGTVYVGGGGNAQFMAIDLASGMIDWTANLSYPAIYEAPIYHDGVVYISSYMSEGAVATAIDANTGEVLWEANTGDNSFFGPALGDDKLFIGSYDSSNLTALHTADGEEAWSVTVENEGFAANPVFHDGNVYAVSANFNNGAGTLRSFDAETGEANWTATGIGNVEAGSPIVFDDLVIVGSAVNPVIKAFDKDSGELVWEADNGGTILNSGSVSGNGQLFVTDTSSQLKIYDVYTGDRLYEHPLNGVSYSGVALTEGQVIALDEASVTSFISPGTLIGTVTDEADEPIEGAVVSIPETGQSAVSDATGSYTLDAMPGEYTVRVASYGYKQVSQDVELVSGFVINQDYQLDAAGLGSLSVTTTEDESGEALQGVSVVLENTPLEGETDSAGQVSFSEVYEGEYDLLLSLSGYEEVRLPVTITAGSEETVAFEMSRISVLVFDDQDGQIVRFLNNNGISAEEKSADSIEDIGNYSVLYMNGSYTSSGERPTKEYLQSVMDKAEAEDVSVVFADTWGPSYGSLRYVWEHFGDPPQYDSYYQPNASIYLRVDDPDHPIFDGMDTVGSMPALTRGYTAWFNQYSGRHLATIGTSRTGYQGSGIAYKGVTEDSAHLLMSSHAASPWVSPYENWTSDQQQILLNAMGYLLDDLAFGEINGTVTDAAGNPLADVAVEIAETGVSAITDESGNYALYHDEGTYNVTYSKTGYGVARAEADFARGSPVTEDITMAPSDSGTISGTITNKITGQEVPYAEIAVYDEEGEVVAEEVSSISGAYQITDLHEGNFTFEIVMRDFVTFREAVTVGTDAIQLDIELYPEPRVAIINDNTRNSIRDVLTEEGITAENYAGIGDVLEELPNLDVVFFNTQSLFQVSTELLDEFRATADEYEVSVIYGDDYYTSSAINHLVENYGDPASRTQVRNTSSSAAYVVTEENPIFGDAEAGDFIDIIVPNRSNVVYFEGYSGYPLADITHAGNDETHGPGVAYTPRTGSSLELLMSGHGVSLLKNTSEFTEAGRDMFVNSILWAAFPEFNVIQGTVTDEQGNPLEATLDIRGEIDRVIETNPETGEFSIGSKDGEFEIEVNAFGYQAHTETVMVDGDLGALTIEMQVDESVGTIEGTFVDEVTTAGIEDVYVQIDGQPREATTNASGDFVIDRLMPGEYNLTAEVDGYVMHEFLVEVTAQEATVFERAMKPSPTIGVIVDAKTSSDFTAEEYLTSRGYIVEHLFYTDLEKIADMDLIFANSDYDNSLIPEEDEFIAFTKEIDRLEKPIIWSGSNGPRGGIRFMIDYFGDPELENRGTTSSSDRSQTATLVEDHPILDEVAFDENGEFTFDSHYYYGFEGYTGDTIATVATESQGELGSFVAYGGRTLNSVEVLLSTMTFGYGFSTDQYFDSNREKIINNAITFALDNEEALVGEVRGSVVNNLEREVFATVTVEETGYSIDTEEDGTFFLGLKDGAYTINIDAFGHQAATFNVNVVEGEVLEQDFMLVSENAGLVSGQITDAGTDEAIEGARVQLVGTPLSGTTDEDGNYEIQAPAANYQLRVTANGYSPEVVPVEVVHDEVTTVNFSLEISELIAFIGTTVNGNRVMPMLEEEGYEAEFWLNSNIEEFMAEMEEYALIIFNDRHTSSMPEDVFREFIDLADEYEISIIFTSQWGNGPMRQLSEFYDDPESTYNLVVPNYINYTITQGHPIFAGYEVGDVIRVLEREGSNQQGAAFENYSGTTIADVTHPEGENLGGGVAYDFRTANSAHILLSGLHVGGYGQPDDRWTADARQIYINAIDWALSASLGEVNGTVTDSEGEPVAGATVTIEDENLTTETNSSGFYRMGVGLGEHEVQVQARGYETQTQTASIEELGTTVELDFELVPTDRMSVSGHVTDADGNGIEGAILTLTEFSGLSEETAETNGEGYYQFDNVLAGDYDLLLEANGYQSVEESITVNEGDNVEQNFTLSEFNIAVIGDHNGNVADFFAENGLAAQSRDWDIVDDVYNYSVIIVNDNDTSDEIFTQLLDNTDEYETSLVFVDTWGNDGSISLLENLNGNPTKLNQGYGEGAVYIEANETHEIFEGLESPVRVHADESPYATFENYEGTTIASLTVDGEDQGATMAYSFQGPNHMHLLLSSFAVNNMIGPDRGWTEDGEQLFIQAIEWARDAEADLPAVPEWTVEEEIISPDGEVELTGTSDAGTTVSILNGEEVLAETTADSDNTFTVQLTDLADGAYELTLEATNVGGTVAGESIAYVMVDTQAPELFVLTPKDDSVFGTEVVEVTGQVTDDNLVSLTIDGEETQVEDNNFVKQIILEQGANTITVVATDVAGHESTVERNVTVNLEGPAINDLEPSTDQQVRPGDTVTVSFTSDAEGGEASYTIQLPALSSDTGANTMEEVEPGVYEGTWTVPTQTDLQGALVEVTFTDALGNTSTDVASGKLYISSEQIDRIEGDDRYDTAIEISKQGWSESDTVILARGDEFADALAGVPLAHKLDVPILLTLQDRLSRNGLAEIHRLGAENVIVLGGDEAIEDSVIDELESAGLDVRRIAGDARFETAALIAAEVSPDGASEVAVANGMDFPDALSVASHAAKEGMPILLTMADRLPVDTEAALSDLGVTDSIVVGEELVITDKVATQLPNPLRLGGDDRYETNIALAEHFGVESNHLYVATGHLYADALTGAVLAAENDSAIVLVHHAVPASVENYISNNDVLRLSIFGGDVAVDLEIEHDLERLLP